MQKSGLSNSGFSLVQISILLTVAMLVMVAVLPSSQTGLISNNSSITKMNTVFSALRSFEAANGYLPCPADASYATGSASYGITAANGGATNNCAGSSPAANFYDSTNHVAIGMVPVRTLGLSNSYAQDGFGRDITYAVDTNATSCWLSSSLPGQIVVADNGTSNNTVAALVSHGADGHGAWLPLTGTSGTAARFNAGAGDTDEHFVNAHGTGSAGSPTFPSNYASITSLVADAAGASVTFVKKPPTSTFDDLVVYNSPLWNINTMPVVVAANVPIVSAPANGIYSTGTVLTFTLTFPSAVTVSGTPYIALGALGYGTAGVGIGASNVAHASYYAAGSTSTALQFQYTVQSSDYAPSGIYMASSITLNGGTITRTGTTSAACPITFSAPNLSGVYVGAAIFVSDGGDNRIEVFSFSGAYVSQFGSAGSGNGQFSDPESLAVDSAGYVYVADASNNRVQKLTASGSFVMGLGDGYNGVAGAIGSHSSANGGLWNPIGVAVDSAGNIWVADNSNNRIQKYNSSGSFLLAVGGTYGSSHTRLANPSSVAVDTSGNVWVTDTNNNRVIEYNSSGTYQNSIGGPSPHTCQASPSGSVPACASGAGNGQFSGGTNLTFDKSGNLWVTDSNNRLQEFNSTGTYQTKFGSWGSGNGYFENPDQVAADSNGNIWVADQGNSRVQVVTPAGSTVLTFGSSGTGNGQFNTEPQGIAISSR